MYKLIQTIPKLPNRERVLLDLTRLYDKYKFLNPSLSVDFFKNSVKNLVEKELILKELKA